MTVTFIVICLLTLAYGLAERQERRQAQSELLKLHAAIAQQAATAAKQSADIAFKSLMRAAMPVPTIPVEPVEPVPEAPQPEPLTVAPEPPLVEPKAVDPILKEKLRPFVEQHAESEFSE